MPLHLPCNAKPTLELLMLTGSRPASIQIQAQYQHAPRSAIDRARHHIVVDSNMVRQRKCTNILLSLQ